MRRWAALLVITLALGVSSSGAYAQGIDDIPSPDELVAADSALTPLRIDWPANGDVVKTPFTVTGVAAPGARLELWLGDQLERVFLADANGRFNTAVSHATEGDVQVHQIDTKGNRLQSVAVAVVWAGAATPLAAQEVGDPSVTDADAAQLDPFERESRTASGLPRVSALDGEIGGGSAPEPPMPSGDPFASTEVQETADVSAAVTAPVTVIKAPPPRGLRGLAEAGGGVAGGAVIGFGGVLVGGALGLLSDGGGGWGVLIGGVFGGALGVGVGIPVGVILIGNLLDGNGKWWAVVIGEALGFLAGIGLTSACYGCGGGAITVVALPLVGAVLGYELTSDASAARSRAKHAIRPTLTPTRDGGYALGLTFAF